MKKHKREEKYVNLSEKKFATAFLKNAVPAAITTVKDGRYIEVSEAFLKLMGMKRSEIVGNTSTGIGFITPEQRQIVLDEFSRKGSIENLELQIRTKGGEQRYGLFNSVMIPIDGENHLLTMVTDITDQKRIEAELRQSEIKYRTIVENNKKADKEREHLISELRKALSNVKKMSGLLPICASCKKIRDDRGYWNQVEKYVSDHSEAQFSHGICPECTKKLYPDTYEKLLRSNKL
ncbi:MAG: hypothetical protein CSYNP_00720 [Syntrophus sp. SKADARSKE-3]|nr:hypothetical protein [Syntrophus sp. SKADARSKE-3]